MAYYEDWESLCDAAQKKCRKILKNDVAPIGKRILQEHILNDIYGRYTPKKNAWVNGTTYQRRNILPNYLCAVFEEDDEILITSRASASKPIVRGYSYRNYELGGFLKMLEEGYLGFMGYFPRPAVTNAQKEIDRSAEIKAAIKGALDREFS